jgi:small subunit ribosomal protein S3
MGQKVSPIGFRTGITLGWKSRWFAPKSNFGEFLVEDQKIRGFIDRRLNRQPPYAAISDIEIERTREEVKVILKTARPGLVIGPKGAEVEKLKEALEELTNRRVNINVLEIARPDLDAKLAAEGIAEQLKRRASFRRAIKQRCEAIMQAGARGVKMEVSGRLGGAEMSRTVKQHMGSIPLTTLDADIDYGFATSFTTYGALGVKVWIHRGMFGEAPPPARAPAPAFRPPRPGRRGRPRGGEGPRHGRGPGRRTYPGAAPPAPPPQPSSQPAPPPAEGATGQAPPPAAPPPER